MNELEEIDLISRQGMTARGLLPETIGVSSVAYVTPVITPTFDPNAGKDDLYNQLLNAYLKEYFSNRGYSKRRDRKAREYFDRMFNYDWNANVGKRKSEFEALQLELQKLQEELQERLRQLDRLIEELEAIARKLEGQGRAFNGTDWVLDPSKVTFSGFDGNMQTWGNRLQTVFNANKDSKIWKEIAGDDAIITLDELKAWQQKKGLTQDGKLGFNTLQAMGFGDQRNTYDWMKPVKPTLPAQPLLSTSYLVTPAWQTPEFIAEVNERKNNASSNQGASLQGFNHFDKQRNDLAEREKIWKELHPIPTSYHAYTTWIHEYNLAKKKGFMKLGGIINKYKQGNKMNNEQELQKAFMAYLIEDAAAQGVQIQSEQDLQAYAQQLGEEGLKAKYQEFMQKMQGGQGVKAALGAKLNYIRKIKGMCPDGQETYFFKDGGSVKSGCKPCMAKAQKGQELKKKGNAIDQFKNRHINPNDTVWVDGDKNKARTLTDDRDRPIVKGMKPYSAAEYQKDMAKGKKGDKAAARRVEKQNEKTMYACGGKSKKKK